VRRYLLILAVILAAVAGVVVLALFRSPTLGLDLQGGLEVILQAKAPQGREITQDDLDRSIEIMRQRIDKLGVSEPVITRQGSDQISVQLAGVHDSGRAAEIIGQTAQLQFFDLQADALPPTAGAGGVINPSTQLLPLLSGQQEAAKTGTPTQWYLYSKDKTRLAGPSETKEDILRQFGGEQPEGSKFYAVPEGKIVLTCSDTAVSCPGLSGPPAPGATYYYLYKYEPNNPTKPVPELTGNDLNADGTDWTFGQGNQPTVELDFTNSGGDKFHEITRDLYQRGQNLANLAGQPGNSDFSQSFAIVLDGEIRSFPRIDIADSTLSDGIAGGRAQITGLDSIQEAKDLALVLQTGALPVEFVQVQREDISATLGEDSLHQALIAGIGGLLAVAFFLLLFYRFLGVIAIIGLGIYGVLLYGAMLLFGVTLTLPGFAGLVLTIGVAADANVVIFERIKEEVRAGKSVRAAISSGYRKGFNTIVDANVVTIITAFVLFAVATGGVKGFALMLIIGTLISMVTAVAVTRALLGVLAGFRWFNNPAFMGASAQKIPAWKLDWFGMVGKLQPSPAKSSEPIETVTLIPMGAARLRVTSFPVIGTGHTAHEWVEPRKLPVSASHCNPSDTVEAIVDGKEPKSSNDKEIPRFTWWDHRGTTEWVNFDFAKKRPVSSVEVYWFDDTGSGSCRVPASWRLLYQDGERWLPVENPSGFGIKKDGYNRVTFKKVQTTGLKLEAKLQPEFSSGILELKVQD